MAEAESFKLKPRWLQGGVLLLVSLIALALLLPLWLEVTQRLEQMRTSRRDNVIWTVVQLEVEFLELEKSATALKYAGTSGLPEVRRRFNVFYSRVQTMQQSPLYREAIGDAGELENLAFVKTGVDSLIYLIDGADSTLVENQPVLMESLQELRVPIRRVVANANYVLTSKTEDARQEAARLVMRLGLVSVLLFGGLMGLALLFLRLFVVYKQRAAENLSTSRRLATVVATSPDAIVVTDASGEIQDFNPAAEVLLGYLRDDALGMNLSAFVETTSGGTVTFPFARRGVMNERLSGLRRDGRVVPIELSQGATSLGRRRVYVFFLRDITERLAADEALLASRDKAVAGERAKAHFLAVMSHEMRTPLNGILGIIELLKDTVTGDKNRYYLSLLENSGQVLLNHINEVLNITEIEARGIRLVKTSYSLDAVLHELIASLRPAAEARGNSLTFTATPQVLGHFVGDAMRLRQVVANILSNAIKFTSNGSIDVTATVHRSGAGVQLDLQVADTGIGIDEDKLGIVFDDFVRLDREKTMQVEGTGLGLGIVRRIVKAMNGKCGVESVKGEGTLFWIELPLSEVMEKAPLPIAASESVPVIAERALDVLLVEDNPTNRLVLHEMLSRGGHFVTEAENGAIGAELARKIAFDLILMDINMPVMGGVEATTLIRSGGASQGARIVALTAHAMDQDVQLYREIGFDRVLSKPLSRKKLYEQISGTLDDGEPVRVNRVLDIGLMEQLIGSLGAEKSAALIQDVLVEGDAFVATLADAQQGDSFRNKVHQFAGTCAIIGAQRMRNTLARLEETLKRSPDENLLVWREPLEVLWSETRTKLEGFLKR